MWRTWSSGATTPPPSTQMCITAWLTCLGVSSPASTLSRTKPGLRESLSLWVSLLWFEVCLKILPFLKCLADRYYWQLYFYIPWLQTVQQRGAAVIKARKLSSAMSAAKAICDHMRDIWTGTPEVNATANLFVYFRFLIYICLKDFRHMND